MLKKIPLLFFILMLFILIGINIYPKYLSRNFLAKNSSTKNSTINKNLNSDGIRISGNNNESNEWWYFDGIGDDGTVYIISFGKEKLRAYTSVEVILPNQKNYSQYFTSSDKNEFYFDPEKCNIKVGKNNVEESLNNYSIHLDFDGLKAELILNKTVQSWIPKISEYHFHNGKIFGWLPAVPAGSVSGNFYLGGQQKDFKGSGYHDHNWTTLSTQEYNKVIDHRYWGRAVLGEYTLIFDKNFSNRELSQKDVTQLYLSKNNNILINESSSDSEATFEVFPPENNNLLIKYSANGLEVNIKVNKEKILTSNVKEDSKYERYLGDISMDIIDHGEKKTLSGKTIWEYMKNP